MKIGRRAMGALSVRYGTQYVTGNIAEAICKFFNNDKFSFFFLFRKLINNLFSDLATGTSIDWVKETLKVPLVYCYEFRDRGAFGFLLPTNQILPNNQEVMDSIVELILQAKRFGYLNNSVSLKASLFNIFIMALVLLRSL